MIIGSQESEERGLRQIAELMCVAARTAPKGKGTDNLTTLIVDGEEKARLAEEMRRIAQAAGADFFSRDAGGIDKASLVVLLGQKVMPMGVKACGYCGFADCAACAAESGLCAVSTGDLGIAISSAATVAGLHHADNRIMFSVGRAALNLGYFAEGIRLAYGIPLSASGKNPFFDR